MNSVQKCDDSEGDASVTQKAPSIPPLTSRQMLIFTTVSVCYIAVCMSSVIIAPFFPTEADNKGISSVHIGFIFATYNLVNCLTSPLFGKYLPVLGAKFTCLAGTWVSGGCNLLFGFLPKISDPSTFLVYCYIIRGIEGAGCAASVTAGMTIIANTFPHRIAKMNGLYEAAAGLGLMLGPPVGGFLYGLGGYQLPFLVLGSLNLLFVVIIIFVLPRVGVDDTEAGSLMKVLRIPAVHPALLVTLVASMTISFLDPTLSIHLQKFNLSPALIGVEFLLIGGMYGIFSPIWGHYADKWRTTRIMMILGLYSATLSCLFMGPSPLLKLPSSIWIVNIGIATVGFNLSLALLAAFADLYHTAEWFHLESDLALQGVISGVFNFAYWIGSFIGPSSAGVLLDSVGFEWTSSIFALFNLSVMLVVSFFCLWEYQCGKGRRPPGGTSILLDAEERKPLIENGAVSINEHADV